MMIQVTDFHSAAAIETKRIARCRNCMGDPWATKQSFVQGERRVVVVAGWGSGSRNLSLCKECATFEAQKLLSLAEKILSAVREVDSTHLNCYEVGHEDRNHLTLPFNSSGYGPRSGRSAGAASA